MKNKRKAIFFALISTLSILSYKYKNSNDTNNDVVINNYDYVISDLNKEYLDRFSLVGSYAYVVNDTILLNLNKQIVGTINESEIAYVIAENSELYVINTKYGSNALINKRDAKILDKNNYVTDLSVYHNNYHNNGFVVTTGNLTYDLTDDEIKFMASIVTAEMGSKYSYDDGLAIASLLLNRCEHENWMKVHGGIDPIAQLKSGTEWQTYVEKSYVKYYDDEKRSKLSVEAQNKFEVGLKTTLDAIHGIRNHKKYTECFAPNGERCGGTQSYEGGALYFTNPYDLRVRDGNPVVASLVDNVVLLPDGIAIYSNNNGYSIVNLGKYK